MVKKYLKGGPMDTSETSVRNYHYTLSNKSEEFRSELFFSLCIVYAPFTGVYLCEVKHTRSTISIENRILVERDVFLQRTRK
jgi:hypothetical protein